MSDTFEYDVAVSFAEADQAIARELEALLSSRNVHVFLDEYKSTDYWGDTVDHLVNLFARKARYCVLLISEHYPLRAWTDAEHTSARDQALRDPEEYIIPIRLDDRDVPGLEEARGIRDAREGSLEGIADWLKEKLAKSDERSGPPAQSHDLRSGNVPSEKDG